MMMGHSPLSAIREEDSVLSDGYEDVSDESEGEDRRLQLQSRLQLSGNRARVQGLMELRELYNRVANRLTSARGEEEDRCLTKEEDKVASLFLEDAEDVKEKKELKVFEQLEQLTGRPSFGSKLSLVEQFIQDKMVLESTMGSEGEEKEDVVDFGRGGLGSDSEEQCSDSDSDISEDEDAPTPTGTEQVITVEDLFPPVKDDPQLELGITEEKSLFEEKTDFLKWKEEEEAKLRDERANLFGEKGKLSKLRKEIFLLKATNTQQLNQISQLENKLKATHLEWSQKASGWNLTRTKMRKQIDEFEKKCQLLEEKLGKLSNNNNKVGGGGMVNVLRPKGQIAPPVAKKKIHFQTEDQDENENQEQQRRTIPTVKPLRSSLKQVRTSVGEDESKENQDPIGSKIEGKSLSQSPPSFLMISPHPPPPSIPKKESPINSISIQNMINNCKNDGQVETTFPNGTRKYVCKSKQYTKTLYKNGDIKEKRSDGSIHYFFATYGLRHYVYPSGLEMTTYKNGQVQRQNPDGTSEILYQNGCVKVIRSDGKEEFIFPDNTVYQCDDSGNTMILLPNGQKEIHNEQWKKRLFPDGTTKTVYLDGSTETVYANGRRRVKNAEGELILDTEP